MLSQKEVRGETWGTEKEYRRPSGKGQGTGAENKMGKLGRHSCSENSLKVNALTGKKRKLEGGPPKKSEERKTGKRGKRTARIGRRVLTADGIGQEPQTRKGGRGERSEGHSKKKDCKKTVEKRF